VDHEGLKRLTYYIDDLKPGMSESLSKTVTNATSRCSARSAATGNRCIRRGIRQATILNGRIAHGMLSASLYLDGDLSACRFRGRNDFHECHDPIQGSGVRIGRYVVTTWPAREGNEGETKS